MNVNNERNCGKISRRLLVCITIRIVGNRDGHQCGEYNDQL